MSNDLRSGDQDSDERVPVYGQTVVSRVVHCEFRLLF